jgi:hypothetical protein
MRINEAMNFESNDKNWKYDFGIMCKKYGRDFIAILKVMWSVNYDVQTQEEFCEMNGIPISFFNKTIK